MTSTFLTSPLDVVKTRLQSDFYKQQLASKRSAAGVEGLSGGVLRQSVRHFSETFQILGYVRHQIEHTMGDAPSKVLTEWAREVHRVEGWRGLFKGLGPNLSGVVPAR